MKVLAIAIIAAVICTPIYGSAQTNDIQIELTKENDFVVKMQNVYNKSGNKMSDLKALDAFNVEKKLFVFKTTKGKFRKLSDAEIQRIAFSRVRQGVLTGKSPKLRVIAWNGPIKNFELPYRDARIKGGALILNQNVYQKHFKASDKLRSNSQEWSDKFSNYWAKIKKDSPEVFSTDFTYENGRGSMSRKMAAAYCKSCVKIEILNMQINPATETIGFRCKEVFYDRWMD